MKLYLQTYTDHEETNDYQLAVEIKKLKIDVNDLIKKNMRKVNIKTDYKGKDYFDRGFAYTELLYDLENKGLKYYL